MSETFVHSETDENGDTWHYHYRTRGIYTDLVKITVDRADQANFIEYTERPTGFMIDIRLPDKPQEASV